MFDLEIGKIRYTIRYDTILCI